MKPYRSSAALLAAAILAATATVSCDNDFDYPPVIVPVATIQPNTTIAQVKAAFWSDDRNYADTIFYNEEGEHIIIAGRVISSDETGNIYKSLVIQDETAALAMSINDNSLSESYKVGQEIVIDLTEMFIGKYNGLQQLGQPQVYGDGYEVTFMTPEFFQSHAQVNGLPEMAKVDTTLTTIADIRALSTPEELQQWQSRLIRLDGVRWEDGGLAPYSESGSSTSRTIVDSEGNTIIARNSNYATFAAETLPSGTGSIVGILSYYGTNWQLLLRDTTDCIGFDGAGGDNPGGNEPGDISEANTTIAQLKAEYWKDDMNYCSTVGQTVDGKDVVIAARVISSDQAGNVFKTLYVQDDTDAIAFSIDASRLYSTYPMGQMLVVNLTGMSIGKYAGMMQIGEPGEYNGTPQVDRMSLTTFRSHVRTAGRPDVSAVKTTDATVAEIAAIGRTDAAGIQKWQGRLVKFTGVHFENGGSQTFVMGSANTNQTLLDAQGKSIIVRTSQYADFGGNTLPAGTGDITGLLGYFNGTWQLLLNDGNACTNFDGQTPSTPDKPSVPTGNATFRKATSVTSGKSYVMVYNGKVAIPIDQKYSYGYLYVEDPVSASGSELTTSASNAITFTASGAGFTMLDSYGRYLSMDGEHNNSFQLYTSAADGSVWTVTFAADGAATITNTLVNGYKVGWKSQYNNLAPTDAPEGLPQLYEKVD